MVSYCKNHFNFPSMCQLYLQPHRHYVPPSNIARPPPPPDLAGGAFEEPPPPPKVRWACWAIWTQKMMEPHQEWLRSRGWNCIQLLQAFGLKNAYFIWWFCKSISIWIWSRAPTLESFLHVGCDLPDYVKLWHDGQVLAKNPEVPISREPLWWVEGAAGKQQFISLDSVGIFFAA